MEAERVAVAELAALVGMAAVVGMAAADPAAAPGVEEGDRLHNRKEVCPICPNYILGRGLSSIWWKFERWQKW